MPNFENLLYTAWNRGEKRDFFFPYFESKNFPLSWQLVTVFPSSVVKTYWDQVGEKKNPFSSKLHQSYVNICKLSKKKKIRRRKEGSLSELFNVNIASRLLEMVGANKNPYITFKITIFCFIWAPTKSLDKQELIGKEKMKADRMMDPIQPTGPIKKKVHKICISGFRLDWPISSRTRIIDKI